MSAFFVSALNYHHHHWAAVVSRGSVKASACRLQVCLYCAVLCQIVSLQYFVQLIYPLLGWSPLSSFLVIWSPSGDSRGPSVISEAVFCPGPFHFSHIADHINCVSPAQMMVFKSLYVTLSILLSILVCAAASLFWACLVQYLGLCTISHSWQHTGSVHLSLQADGKGCF